jgi:hypothetical protein
MNIANTDAATERCKDGVGMAKRENTTKRTNNATKRTNRDTTRTGAPRSMMGTVTEQRVVAFAEELGRIAGTVQAKADGWMDREILSRQIASVRDAAANLLGQLAGGAAKGSRKKPAAAARGRNRGRSGGMVDAPGKKHRKPMPTDPETNVADAQAAKMRAAKTMTKTSKLRGRG